MSIDIRNIRTDSTWFVIYVFLSAAITVGWFTSIAIILMSKILHGEVSRVAWYAPIYIPAIFAAAFLLLLLAGMWTNRFKG
jgi:hypothetical protein